MDLDVSSTVDAARSTTERFARQGLLFPLRVLTEDEARRYRLACDELEERLGGRPRTVDVRQMHLHFPWAYELATTPRILDVVETLLGPNLLIWATELFAKHPHDPTVRIAWHRDRDYMGLDSLRTLTAWVALSPCNESNGCLLAVPGPDHGRIPEPLPERTVPVCLRPGEMSLHDPDLWHGSGPNLADEKRVGFAIRFVAPSVRPRHGRPPAVLARGRDDHGNFTLVGAPAPASEAEALDGMRVSARRHLMAILENLGDRAQGAEGKI